MSDRCRAKSPIYKFDEGPRQCRGEAGHTGAHFAKTSDGAHVDRLYDYDVIWTDSDPNAISHERAVAVEAEMATVRRAAVGDGT